MRPTRPLAAIAAIAVVTLLLSAVTASGQSEGPASVPLARQPDGALPLEGTPWRLVAYRRDGQEAVPGPEVAATLRLADGRIEASGGCSRIRGRYATLGGAISFRLRKLKPPACAEQASMVQLAMASGLRRAAEWERVAGADGSGDELILRSTAGQALLRFGLDGVATLESTDWMLEAYTFEAEELAASGQQSALLRFLPERSSPVRRRSVGEVTGSSGCNGIVGRYTRAADVIGFRQLQLTDAPCTPELARQEAAMVAILDAADLQADLGYDRLTLTAPEAGSLAFVSARPLEGSTWMLRGEGRPAQRAARVTLRLDAGQASGDGPCGPYRASYGTDGVFITFRDVQGAREGSCSEADAEKALLEALRDAVRVERDDQLMRLRDVRGRVLLAFELPGVA